MNPGLSSVAALLVALLWHAGPAHAHGKHLSRSRWRAVADQGVVGTTMTFEASDLSLAVRLPEAGIDLPRGSRERLAAVERRITDQLGETIVVTNGGVRCPVRPLRVLRKTWYEIGLRWDCPKPLTQLVIELGFLERLPVDHKQVARFDVGRRRGADVRTLTREKGRFRHDFAKVPPPAAPRSAKTAVAPIRLPLEEEAASVTVEEPPEAPMWRSPVAVILVLLLTGGVLAAWIRRR